MTEQPSEQKRQKNMKKRNLYLGLALSLFVAVMYALAMVKYDHLMAVEKL